MVGSGLYAALPEGHVDPDPSKDETVHLWYVAAAAEMQNRRQWGTALVHLHRARAIYPLDAHIMFYFGAVHEFFASPVIQNLLLTAPDAGIIVGTRDPELVESRQFLEAALNADPNFAEANLRLGRVLTLLGNPAAGIPILQKAAKSLTDPQLRYYAALFLGRAQQGIGNYDAAFEQFESAAKLYPGAQSPFLAISYLMRWSKDLLKAYKVMEQFIMIPSQDMRREDPWRDYDVSHVCNADSLMNKARQLMGGRAR